MPPLPLPYRILLRLCTRSLRVSDPWWDVSRPGIRLLRVSALALQHVVDQRGAIPSSRDGLPADAHKLLVELLAEIDWSLARWLELVEEWRASPLLCRSCGSPRSDFSTPRCPRCPPEPAQAQS